MNLADSLKQALSIRQKRQFIVDNLSVFGGVEEIEKQLFDDIDMYQVKT